MDFSSLAGPIAKAGAPVIGGILGGLFGPLGASVGTKIGSAIGDALGTEPTPEAITKAIQEDPVGAAEKLKALDTSHGEAFKAMVEAEAREVESGNDYGKAMLVSLDPYVRNARPTVIYMLAGCAGLMVATGCVSVFTGLAAEFAKAAQELAVPLGALGAVATGAAWSRGKEKIAALVGRG